MPTPSQPAVNVSKPMNVFAQMTEIKVLFVDGYTIILDNRINCLSGEAIRFDDLSEKDQIHLKTISSDLLKLDNRFRAIVRTPHNEHNLIDIRLTDVIVHYKFEFGKHFPNPIKNLLKGSSNSIICPRVSL